MEAYLNFKDKVVIVTGASSGIGAETAVTFSKFGANLTIVGRNEERLAIVAEKCENNNGLSPLRIILDLTHPGSCEMVINKTLETYGNIDVLVNCAGVFTLSSIFDESMSTFDDMMAINMRVPFLLTQLAIPHLVKTKGNIVNVASSMTTKHKPGMLVYTLLNTAMEKFTLLAAAELVTEGVRINIVSPGPTRTNVLANLNMTGSNLNFLYEALSAILPCGKILEPSEIALHICVVASDMFPHMNGSTHVIDGAGSLV
jgi:NAD(P)-dependent dehydrogenase (short-subunit alcohol dehydrogenase family)